MTLGNCKHCGLQLTRKAKFCAQCGAKVEGRASEKAFQSRDEIINETSDFEDLSSRIQEDVSHEKIVKEEGLTTEEASDQQPVRQRSQTPCQDQFGSRQKKKGRPPFTFMNVLSMLSTLALVILTFLPGFYGQRSFFTLVSDFSRIIEEASLFLRGGQVGASLSQADLSSLAVVEDFSQAMTIILCVGLAFLALVLLFNLLKQPLLSFLSSLIAAMAYVASLATFYYTYLSLSEGLGEQLAQLNQHFAFEGISCLHYGLIASLVLMLLFTFITVFATRKKKK